MINLHKSEFYPNNRTPAADILPCTTAERSFSTLRRIMGYLRSTVGETRLSSLALITIHREITIDIENILDILAQNVKIGNSTLILCAVIWEICKLQEINFVNDINVSNILSTYASTLNYFITFYVLLNHVSPIIKFADLSSDGKEYF